MMKGLFNYEKAYCAYTRLFLEDLVRDGILYAEIRPNFMPSNQLYRDDGSGLIDNRGIVRILVDVVSAFGAEMAAAGRRFFGGIKIIYSTPRVFSPDDVAAALDECLEFKKQWPEWIAGKRPCSTSSHSTPPANPNPEASISWARSPRAGPSRTLPTSCSTSSTSARPPASRSRCCYTAARRSRWARPRTRTWWTRCCSGRGASATASPWPDTRTSCSR